MRTTSRQEYVTRRWLQWRKDVFKHAPEYPAPTFAEQIERIREFAADFDADQLAYAAAPQNTSCAPANKP